jgi:LPS O-antigen subunit length determinant protein (WzzB/FepE family)
MVNGMEKKQWEIDLRELFYDSALVVKKNIVLILTLTVLFSVLGLVYAIFSKKVFESKMIVTSGLLTLTYTEELLEDINLLIKEGSNDAVSAKLNIAPDVVDQIVSFKVEMVFDNKSQPLKENEKIYLSISVKTESVSVFPEIQKGIIFYFDNNPFVKVRIQQRRKYYQELIAEVKKEIRDLEQLKNNIAQGEFFQKTQGNIMFDPTVVNTKIIDLTKEKIGFEHSLELSDNIQLINGLTPFNKPVWPKKSISIIVGFFTGLFVSAITIFTKIILDGIKRHESKQLVS